jgi:type IV pilus assembly protein PilW
VSTVSPGRSARRQLGLSLIELMVAVVIGLILIGGLIQVYLSSKQSYNAQEQLARMQESGRFAMDLITRDLRRAGYWGGDVVALDSFDGSNPVPVPPAHACGTSNEWGRMIRWRVSGLNNTNAGYDCASDYLGDTDILAVRYAGFDIIDIDTTTTPLPAGALYVRTTLRPPVGRIFEGEADADNQLVQAVGTPDHLEAVVRPLVSNAYYVGDSGRTCNGQPVPSLYQVRLHPQTGVPAAEEVAPGVEQLQVRYLLNNTYVDANAVGNNWPDVTAVRVWLLVRGECPEPGLGSTVTYVMGDTPWPPAPDDFRRQLYVSTVMLRNTLVR